MEKERLVTISAKVPQAVKEILEAEAKIQVRRPCTLLAIEVEKLTDNWKKNHKKTKNK